MATAPGIERAPLLVLPRALLIYAVTAATAVYCNANGVLISTSVEGLLS
jgi:hypothetical protein